MVKKSFSTSWKGSAQVRKQRKYKVNAPLHIKKKFVHIHLSKNLRNKYPTRNVQARKNDKVRIMRGKFAKKEGKIERIDLKRERVFVTGAEIIKKDGSKILVPLDASNLMAIVLDLSDRKRKSKLESYAVRKSSISKSSSSETIQKQKKGN